MSQQNLTSDDILVVRQNEVIDYQFSVYDQLRKDVNGALAELVNGSPTVASTPTGLTLSAVAINNAAVMVKGVSRAAGTVLLVTITVGSATVQQYTLTFTCTTDAGQTFKLKSKVKVIA